MVTSRRDFIFSVGAAACASGCRVCGLGGGPDLRFGVVSDIHVTTPCSTRIFERALRYFRLRGVDAVVVPGDLTDWGLRSSLVYVRDAWDRVFAGTGVVPLFCTGNHDYEGWAYGDMTMEMHANGYSETERLTKDGNLGKIWTDVFDDQFAPVRLRRVKGYDFLCSEYEASDGEALRDWLKKHGDELRDERPFFYFQHNPLHGTTADSIEAADSDIVREELDAYSNCIAFTGHTHMPFIDERQIWQGSFTVIGTPSLSYACLPPNHENGGDDRNGLSKLTMAAEPLRRDLRGGQGFVVDVWANRVVVSRVDLEEEASDLPDWVIPLPVEGTAKPFAADVRDAHEPVPEFPRGATLDIETRNAENRSGHWAIVMNCEFPSAIMPSGHRVFDYEIRAVPKDGGEPLVKRFLSPAYAKMARYEPARQRFWFDVAELPQGRDYVIEVRAFNCFGRAGAPLISTIWHSKPGLAQLQINSTGDSSRNGKSVRGKQHSSHR